MDCDASMLKKLPLVIFISVVVYVAIWCVGELGLFHLIYADCYDDHLQNPQYCEQYHFFFWPVHLMDNHEGFFVGAFTGVLALFTYFLKSSTDKLWKAGDKQLEVVRQQIDLAHEEFAATHRPKLIVRKVAIEDDLNSIVPHPKMICYDVVNVGDVEAKIISHDIVVLTDPVNKIPPRIDYGKMNAGFSVGIKIVAGAATRLEHKQFADTIKLVLNRNIVTRDTGSVHGITLAGIIFYSDKIGVKRQTSFLRSYNFVSKRFEIVKDDDYEYAD